MAIGIKYSTGPVENAIRLDTLPGLSRVVFAKVLNNGSRRTTVTVRLFRLNGAKVLVDSRTLTLNPGSSSVVDLVVADLFQFEVQFIVRNKNVLVSAWGKNRNGVPVAVHRFTQQELNKTFIDL
ncbi:hypothetical protein FHS18_006011 [Paenibacillus phyllosphaerae]|uniref:Uncharacterized protein n=1 Tax=Paenibacillus phyllosphaerae TaxID=274593 RepID=A0A7W5B4R1_9BACL|nr:hypothetical protein [Paenibacillus phyllosphaerae]MBB3113896.1 hypothetical protein [Paenibacillus phyllosphaerae]